MKALVVDDSMVMRKVLSGALNRAGIPEVAQAPDGAEAVAQATPGAFDLILMDWNMPRLTGIEAVRQIRANGVDTPIMMVTTEAEKCRVIEALKAGANSYVLKPVDPQTLVEKIQAQMARSVAS